MNTHQHPDTLEQPRPTVTRTHKLSIGLPAGIDPSERRFPITPEGVAVLTDRGFSVLIEQGAGALIHYTDTQYSAQGAHLVSRSEALGADIVMYLAPMSVADIRHMRRGTMLFTLYTPSRHSTAAIKALLDRNILTIALDLISDTQGHLPFADILAEIDGRAALARATAMLADPVHGKGILLGGVPSIVPCEIAVIGSGIAACAAARSAVGAGAIVRMFDNDVYRLRIAKSTLGDSVITSALHPRVLSNALRTADVIVYTGVTPTSMFGADTVALMKRGAVVFDLTCDCGHAFPSLPTVDLAMATPKQLSPDQPSRACFVNAGSAVPRTAAMAISDTFTTMLGHTLTSEGATNALRLLPGLQQAALTFMGKCVNHTLAFKAGVRHTDIALYLTLS